MYQYSVQYKVAMHSLFTHVLHRGPGSSDERSRPITVIDMARDDCNWKMENVFHDVE